MNNTNTVIQVEESFEARLELERREQKISDNLAVAGLSENLKGWQVKKAEYDGIISEGKILLTAPNGLEMIFFNANGPRHAWHCKKGNHNLAIWSLDKEDKLTNEINISGQKSWQQIAKDITRRIDIDIYKASVDKVKAREQAYKDYEKNKAEVCEQARKLCYEITGFSVESAYPKEVYFRVCVPVEKMNELAAWVKANTKQD